MKKLLILLASGLVAISAIRAAEPIHVFITGQSTGAIAGDNTDGSIAGLAFEHNIISPRDPASGLPTGKRMHKPFTIVKSIDTATPLLYQSLVTNQNLPTVTMKFYKPAVGGEKPELYYMVTLTNASISSVRNWKPNTRDLSADRAGDLEEVSFTYQKITWTWVKGGISASDDWEVPAT
jgi:type VI secretion system secreted protein Hcp